MGQCFSSWVDKEMVKGHLTFRVISDGDETESGPETRYKRDILPKKTVWCVGEAFRSVYTVYIVLMWTDFFLQLTSAGRLCVYVTRLQMKRKKVNPELSSPAIELKIRI